MASKRVQFANILAAILVVTTESTSSETSHPVYGAPLHEAPPTSRAQYAYAYDIRDPQSGVYTSKKESRDGDVVFGNYVVQDPDGSRRTVYYSADAERGFNAEIRRQGTPSHQVHGDHSAPIHLPLVVPVVHAHDVAEPSRQPPPQTHQIQFGAPLAISLAPVILTRTAPSQSEFEPPRYRTSLISPTHSYFY